MIEKEWIPVIATLITVFGALGGVTIGSVATYFFNRKNLKIQLEKQAELLKLQLDHQIVKEDKTFKREKIEELFMLTIELQKSVLILRSKLFSKDLTLTPFSETSEVVTQFLEPIPRIQLLVQLYFPEVEDEFKIFGGLLKSLVQFLANPGKSPDFDKMLDDLKTLGNTCSKINNKIQNQNIEDSLVK